MSERLHASKALRLVRICDWMRDGERLSVATIARRLGVTYRTAYRYIGDVEELGIPLVVAGSEGRLPLYEMFRPRQGPTIEAVGRMGAAPAGVYDRGLVRMGLPPGRPHTCAGFDSQPRSQEFELDELWLDLGGEA